MSKLELVTAIISFLAAFLTFIVVYRQSGGQKKQTTPDEILDAKLRKILSAGENNHTNTKHLRTIKSKLRGIDQNDLERALRRVATSGRGSDGKEVWTLDPETN